MLNDKISKVLVFPEFLTNKNFKSYRYDRFPKTLIDMTTFQKLSKAMDYMTKIKL